MKKYLCAIPLPVDYALAIREIQEQYKSASWNIYIPPHITLIPPGAALASEDRAEEMLCAAIAHSIPFDITVRGALLFHNQANTVVAHVEPSEDLSRLQYAVHNASIGFVSKPNVRTEHFGNHFNPHITLSNKLHPALAEQIVEQLNAQHIDFTFCCDSIVLFSKEPKELLWSESKRLSF